MRASVGIKLGFWLALLGTASTGLTGYYVYDRSRQLLVGAAQAQLLSTVQACLTASAMRWPQPRKTQKHWRIYRFAGKSPWPNPAASRPRPRRNWPTCFPPC
ncbi:hypothetical protein [Methylomonas koyamae]|uniref:hypothetical protein n=1 Tax=Methylomonas koyamae TaxID=702114 RepID=UPI0006D236F3|nr:hypothetical protein [Methylomonas koyamae]